MLVLDANILMRAVLGKRARALLAKYGERIEFVAPDVAFDEARRRLPQVIEDKVLIYKHIVKNVCYQNGYTATFMPKPLFGDNGSGMHTHQSLWKDGVPLFYDKDGYALLSDTARWYIGGLLKHAPAVLAFAAPTTNSYRRLVPGYEAPIKLAYSARNRSACIRIPTYSPAPAARGLEVRSPDPMGHPVPSFR